MKEAHPHQRSLKKALKLTKDPTLSGTKEEEDQEEHQEEEHQEEEHQEEEVKDHLEEGLEDSITLTTTTTLNNNFSMHSKSS
jgi:hypothetical protein